MEEPVDTKHAIGELFKIILKDRQDLADQIEDYKFDAAIGKFVREFEHIKLGLRSFIGQCGIVNLKAQGRNGAAIQSRGFTPQAHTTSCHTENARDRKIR